jgi:hypothetical protein
MSEEQNMPMQVQSGISGLKPLLLLLGVAGAIAVGVGVALWSQGPNYSLLFGNLANSDAAQVVQSLEPLSRGNGDGGGVGALRPCQRCTAEDGGQGTS